MTKEVSLKKKFCLRSVTSTIHTSHLEYMYIQVITSSTVSPIQAAIRTFQISPLKMNNKFQGYHPTCILSLDKFQ